MKITKSELKLLIQEEVKKQKKVVELTNKKNSILKQLNEMDYNIEETEVDEAFLGMMGAEEKARKQNLETQFDALIASGAIGNKAAFLEKAKTDNHNGILSTQVGREGKFAGKKIIIYTPKLSTIQKLGSAAGGLTAGGGTGEKQAPL